MSAPSIHLTFGAIFDGVTVSFLLYGVTCCQTVQYYRHYPDDRSYLKKLVAFIWLADTIHQTFLVHALWTYLIKLRATGDITIAEKANWSLIAQVIPTEICAAVVECFFIIRIWILDARAKRTLVLLIPMSVSFVISIAYVVKCFKLPDFASSTKMPWLLGIFGSLRALTDIAIAFTMCRILYADYRTNLIQRSVSLVKVIVNHTLTTGLLTSVLTTVYVIVYLSMPLNMVYISIYVVHGKIYVNSMLASLNSRKSLRVIAAQDLDLISLQIR